MAESADAAHLERGMFHRRRTVFDRDHVVRSAEIRRSLGNGDPGDGYQPPGLAPRGARVYVEAQPAGSVAAGRWTHISRRRSMDFRCARAFGKMVSFAQMNLIEPVYVGKLDCIFCMNVLMYFSERAPAGDSSPLLRRARAGRIFSAGPRRDAFKFARRNSSRWSSAIAAFTASRAAAAEPRRTAMVEEGAL